MSRSTVVLVCLMHKVMCPSYIPTWVVPIFIVLLSHRLVTLGRAPEHRTLPVPVACQHVKLT